MRNYGSSNIRHAHSIGSEICIRGQMIMKGYKGNLEATRDMIDAEGWLHTGDIGYYDDEEW